ncbi:sulfite exporter TauE/SafE family protein [Mesorhizobium sp.]|uniref:sulfite exporter TauE/SafE family protein n=1 Tax=Mesorhizobium sp. TaxID=1871066 RepID=UPI00121A2C6F|nr:sulfite exporter TauE/SafE family protein [Mesorhizobium sp.]TIO08762.1 MAG: sulfite exporter TauE/SafE family protein [Mesorhizobium sp.]TIO36281.1 MAG: sulfite exporter TauE/SafE family protein [Mesorhizobium sp.]TIP09334.1 MAG: sulfite exporter TauE/SafE family protein [Mesorhizobium sp.]
MQDFILFALVGFVGQAVDGALGMAYGVVCSTTLLGFGVSPAHASASVHAAELFTTAASGSAHIYHRNIDWKLFWRLMPFGVLGGVLGAFVLTSFEGAIMRPYVTTYLALVGAWLLFRSFRRIPSKPIPVGAVAPLGLGGGFLDAAGGGGWGPMVTTGLLGFGGTPRYVIGTVNASEFLITLSVSLTFLFALLTGHWEEAGELTENLVPVAGLILGGVVAAPIAGLVVKSIAEETLLGLVGVLIIMLAGWQTAELLEMV